MNPQTGALERHLAANRERLLGFIRSRISDPDLAEDILQDSILKALRAAPDLRSEEKLTSWFYQIVRNAIADVYRRQKPKEGLRAPYADDLPEQARQEDEAVLCECFRELIPTLKPEYAELIERLELGREDPEAVADELGITRNNLKVRRHRARQQLRERLQETCRTCARHGCLDCACSRQT